MSRESSPEIDPFDLANRAMSAGRKARYAGNSANLLIGAGTVESVHGAVNTLRDGINTANIAQCVVGGVAIAAGLWHRRKNELPALDQMTGAIQTLGAVSEPRKE